MKKALPFIFTSLILTGCCSLQASGDRYNLEYITPGMTKEEVVEIMRDPVECVKVDEEEVMMWNGACVSLVNGQVVDKAPLDSETALRFQTQLHESTAPVDQLVDEIYDSANRSPASEKPIEVPIK